MDTKIRGWLSWRWGVFNTEIQEVISNQGLVQLFQVELNLKLLHFSTQTKAIHKDLTSNQSTEH